MTHSKPMALSLRREMVKNRDNDQRFKNFPDNIEWSETVVDGTWLRKGRFFLKENRKKKG